MPPIIRLACLIPIAACTIPTPGPFYNTPANQTAPHGTLLNATAIPTTLTNATAYKIIYNSEALNGAPIPISGTIFIPSAPPPPTGRNTIAWAHPTTGTAPGCAPSLDNGAPGGTTTENSIPGLATFIAAGDIVTATDYQGLGETGIHPYLIGKAEGQNVIDSVLATKSLPGANISGRYVVWGHSQGGHAALFTGEISATYAPSLHLLGVAAAAPVTDTLGELTEPFNNNTGRLLHAYVYTAYSKTYNVPLTTIISPNAVPAVEKTATQCLDKLGDDINAIIAASHIPTNFLSHPPQTTPPWPKLFKQNNAGLSPPGAPLLITQGTADPTVEPHWTESFAANICAHHEIIAFHELQGVNHLAIAQKSLPLVTNWIAARFASTTPPNTCKNTAQP